uniref:Chemokine interleukin-8-like domain-containing protein n=1 Tax=Cyprinus carpio TaxID=7962 RepID=A0A8C2HM85_CYPCA
MQCRYYFTQYVTKVEYNLKTNDFLSCIGHQQRTALSEDTIYFISPTAHASVVPKRCCFNFIDFQIPNKKIVSALKTSSRCPSPGIVVTTPRTEFCVDPAEAWIKSFMENHPA